MRHGGRNQGLALVVAALAVALLAPPSANAAGSGSFGPTSSMGSPRQGPVAAPLPDGRVLVAGGFAFLGGLPVYRATAQLFDPATNSFATTGSMGVARESAVAAPLPGGRVLVAGGTNAGSDALATTEVFNPATQIFSSVGPMASPRSGAVAAPLPDGRVLVAGGFNGSDIVASAEVFNPATNTFSSSGVGSMTTPRGGAAAVLLGDGRILVAGGDNADGHLLSTAEVFNPATTSFSSAGIGSMGTARFAPAAAPLPDGRALVTGGANGPVGTPSAEAFDPATNGFSSAGIGPLGTARWRAAGAPLADGRVLVAGGFVGPRNGGTPLATAEIYAATNSFAYRLKGRKLLVSVQASGTVYVRSGGAGGKAAAAKRKGRKAPLKVSGASGGPGTIAVRLRLNKRGKAALRRKGRLKLRAQVTFTPQGGLVNTQRAKLKIKQGKRSGKR